MSNTVRHSRAARILPSLLLVLVAARAVPAAVPLPEPTVGRSFGVNIHFRGAPRDLDLIRQAGFGFIRMDLTWAAVERKKGTYDFAGAGYDALTAGCRRRGIRILYILDYSNKLYEPERSVRSETGRKAFAAFAEAAAHRYKGHGVLWEIWNEPNIRQFWTPQPSAEDYCKLVRAAAPLIKKADPSGLVVAGATSGIPFDWLEQCFKKGLLELIDVLSVHPYRPHPPETVIGDYDRLRRLIDRYAPPGKRVPVISGEWGYSNINWDKKPLSRQTQARYLVREFLVNLYRNIPVSIWYDWKNDGTDPDEREHNFGTVTHLLEPKQAYTAAAVLTKNLGGYRLVKRLELPDAKDFALLLARGTDRAVVLWTTGGEHDVTLPLEPGHGLLLDMLAERKEPPAIIWGKPGPTITASQSPQYLLLTGD